MTADAILHILETSPVGLSTQEIAKRMTVSEQAVKCSCLRLYKAGLIDRVQRIKKTHLGKRLPYVYSLAGR